jgi:hypothetical protein
MEITDTESAMRKNVRALVLPHTSSQWEVKLKRIKDGYA